MAAGGAQEAEGMGDADGADGFAQSALLTLVQQLAATEGPEADYSEGLPDLGTDGEMEEVGAEKKPRRKKKAKAPKSEL